VFLTHTLLLVYIHTTGMAHFKVTERKMMQLKRMMTEMKIWEMF